MIEMIPRQDGGDLVPVQQGPGGPYVVWKRNVREVEGIAAHNSLETYRFWGDSG